MDLPDELWQRVILGAVERSRLDYRDVCLISMACRALRRVSELDCIWRLLWDQELGSSSSMTEGETAVAWKRRFATRYGRIKLSRQNDYNRRMLRIQSQILLLQREYKTLARDFVLEKRRVALASRELIRADNARQASTALQIWQPQAVRTRHQQVIQQQQLVDPDSHRHNLEMEVKVCREQMQRLQRNLNSNRTKLARAEEELRLLNYHPTKEWEKNRGCKNL
ncbi:F-box protein SKIP24 [Selaginella moellendorffii]|nr:F-box protein SKIP24 [Selaginella moellendorffii]|eukprot:XP_024526335.1 F-box protein SKIP24 [Selaginella moellendorffii]